MKVLKWIAYIFLGLIAFVFMIAFSPFVLIASLAAWFIFSRKGDEKKSRYAKYVTVASAVGFTFLLFNTGSTEEAEETLGLVDESQAEQVIVQENLEPHAKESEETAETEEPEEEIIEEVEEEPDLEEPEQTEPEKQADLEDIPEEIEDLRLTDVRNDTTGNWKKAVTSSRVNIPENALMYYDTHMNEGEVHFIISFATNTTTMVSDIGGILLVNITEYVDREEHSADTIGSGMTLGSYNIYKDSGEIEEH